MATVAVTHFSDRLADAVERKSSQLVVGLDPVVEQMPAEVDGDLFAFCSGIIDAIAPYAVAVKPQSAFFEAHGGEGVSAFAQVCEYARAAGLIVIADAKRGDIGSTAPTRRRSSRSPTPSRSTPISAATPSSPFSRRAAAKALGSSAS
jgi:orotidine-5'-phosphate decarboxylase